MTVRMLIWATVCIRFRDHDGTDRPGLSADGQRLPLAQTVQREKRTEEELYRHRLMREHTRHRLRQREPEFRKNGKG